MTCASCDGTGRWLVEDGWTASQCPTCGGSGEAGAWDREAALRLAERIDIGRHTGVPQGGWVKAAIASAALLRAADAEIARLRAREADAERMAEAVREAAETFAWCHADEYERGWAPAADAMMDLRAALAAWDASRGEGGR